MSHALVIKSGSFAENKLTTVTLSKQIHCTGLSLDITEITATAFGTQTITATVTPANCTDVLTWSSSNDNIASVEDGIITLKGLGEATITATCGEHSATCIVTVDNVVITSGWKFGALYSAGSNDYTTEYFPENYKRFVYADEIPLDSTRLRFSRASSCVGDFNLTGQMFPYGTGRVKLESTDISGVYYVLFFNSTQSATNQSAIIKQVEKNAPSAPSSGVINDTYTIPSNADSFGISVSTKTQYAETDEPDAIAATTGLKITLMTPTT